MTDPKEIWAIFLDFQAGSVDEECAATAATEHDAQIVKQANIDRIRWEVEYLQRQLALWEKADIRLMRFRDERGWKKP